MLHYAVYLVYSFSLFVYSQNFIEKNVCKAVLFFNKFDVLYFLSLFLKDEKKTVLCFRILQRSL